MSSTDVKIFEKEEFGSVRVAMQGDDPWFVASDAAKPLGYGNPANAINTHCKKINKITLSPDLGGRGISSKMPPVVMDIIPESDVYRLLPLRSQAMRQRYQFIAGGAAAIGLVILFHHGPQTNAEHDDMKMQIITSDVRNTKFFPLIADILLLPGCGRYDGTHINCEPQLGECGGVEDHAAHVGRRQCLEASGQGHNLNGASDAFLGEFLLHHLG